MWRKLPTHLPTPHDSCGSVGYKITYSNGNEELSIGLATDIGHITDDIRDNLLGCDSVIIECNHDTDMLMYGPYPYELKLRIASKKGHLPNSDCAAFCSELAASGTKSIMLAHLSEENNTPEIAYSECMSAVADESVKIFVASPTSPIWIE